MKAAGMLLMMATGLFVRLLIKTGLWIPAIYATLMAFYPPMTAWGERQELLSIAVLVLLTGLVIIFKWIMPALRWVRER